MASSRIYKRALVRFSLKTLLVLVLLVAVAFGLRSIRLKQHHEACEELSSREAHSNNVYLDIIGPERMWNGASGTVRNHQFYRKKLGNRCVEWLEKSSLAVAGRKDWELFGPSCGSREIALLASLLHVHALSLNNIDLRPEDMKVLTELTELRILVISSEKLSDDDIPYLSRLTHLEYLELYGTQLSERGIGILRDTLKNCELVVRNF